MEQHHVAHLFQMVVLQMLSRLGWGSVVGSHNRGWRRGCRGQRGGGGGVMAQFL